MKDFSRRKVFGVIAAAPIAAQAAMLKPAKFCRVCRDRQQHFNLLGYAWGVCCDCEDSIVRRDDIANRAQRSWEDHLAREGRSGEVPYLPSSWPLLPSDEKPRLEWWNQCARALSRHFRMPSQPDGLPLGVDYAALKSEWAVFAELL